MNQNAEVENQNRRFGEGEAEGVEEEAVPLLLWRSKSAHIDRGEGAADGPYHAPLVQHLWSEGPDMATQSKECFCTDAGERWTAFAHM